MCHIFPDPKKSISFLVFHQERHGLQLGLPPGHWAPAGHGDVGDWGGVDPVHYIYIYYIYNIHYV